MRIKSAGVLPGCILCGLYDVWSTVRISTYFAVIGNCVSRKYGGLPIPSALANVGNTRPSPQSSFSSLALSSPRLYRSVLVGFINLQVSRTVARSACVRSSSDCRWHGRQFGSKEPKKDLQRQRTHNWTTRLKKKLRREIGQQLRITNISPALI